MSLAPPVAGDAYGEIRREVLVRLDRARLDPDQDPNAVAQLVEDAVRTYQTGAHLGRSPALRDPEEMIARVLRSVTGHGPLTELLDRPDVEEIFIEGAHVTYLDGTGQLHALPVPTTEDENRQLVDRLLSSTDRHLDAQSPIVQARVLDGTARLTATIPPVADRLSATIRRHLLRREALSAFVERDSLTPPAAALLAAAMRTNTSIVVSGPPGAGKTSILAGLLAAAPPHHCIRACEEIRELHVPLAHGAYYEARPAALDGSGEIPLRSLVKFVLAMRPDRIVVGEVRGAEAFELTRAVNAGCGFLCTVHANSAKDALTALVNAAIMAGENVTEPIVRKVFASTIDLVVHCDRDDVARADGTGVRRQVTEVLAVVPSLHDDFTTEPIFVRERLGAPLTWTGAVPEVAARLERVLPEGVPIRDVLEGRRTPW